MVNQDEYFKYLDFTSDPIVCIDLNGNIIFANKRICKILGYKKSEIINKNWFKIFLPKKINVELKREFKKVNKGEIKKLIENCTNILTKDDKIIEMSWSQNALRDKNGKVNGIMLSGEDLRKKNNRDHIFLASITENCHDAIASLNLDGSFTFWNKSAEELFGYKKEEIIGKPFGFIVPDDLKHTCFEILEEVSDIGYLRNLETERLAKDGSRIPVEITISRMDNAKGENIGFSFIMRDFTKRSEAENKLNEKNRFLKNILDSLNHPFYIVDAEDYKIISANSYYPKSIWKNKKCYEVTHQKQTPCDGINHKCPLKEVKNKKRKSKCEHVHYDKDGKKKYFEVHGFPIFDEYGNVNQMIEYSLDISDRKKAERKLNLAYKKLKSVNQLKDYIMSNVSHELKTPLTIIKSSIEILKEEMDHEELLDIIELAENAVKRQTSIIDDLITISNTHIEEEDTKHSINFNEIILEAIEDLRPMIDKSGISVNFDPDYSIPDIYGDYGLFKKAVKNLAHNGIKFNKENGKLDINLNYDKKMGQLILSVKDTGIGIKNEDEKLIFEAFTQVDPSYSRNYEGAGNGLAAVKRITEKYSGSATFESEYGKGSTFYIKLPIKNKV